MMPLQNTMTRIEIPMVMHTEDTISCFADLQASSFFPAPRNWEVTTAPPVANAANTLMIRLLNISIRDTPETAASPAEEIMTVSAIPTVIASACSNKSGTISFFRSSFENSCCFVLLSSISFIASIAFYPIIYPSDIISENCPMPPYALLPL